jgi:hypothetical protein
MCAVLGLSVLFVALMWVVVVRRPVARCVWVRAGACVDLTNRHHNQSL